MARPWTVRLDTRAELRRALLAAGETCWIYAVVLTLSAIAGFPRALSPIGIFLMYWAGLLIGRYLPRVHRSWRILQAVDVLLAGLLLALILRVDIYRDVSLLDPSWLTNLFKQLFNLSAGFTAEQIATVALLYAYVRGVGFGQRPLTLWFVGFQFRLGVLVLFMNGLLSVLTRSVDWRAPLVVYFVVSLQNISLARIDEGGSEQALGKRWALLLPAASLVVVGLGLSITPLFTVAAANALLALLSPLSPVFEFVLNLILLPLFVLIPLLFNLLAPLFRLLAEAFRSLESQVARQLPGFRPASRVDLPDLSFALPYLELLLVAALVFGVALIIANALQHRMNKYEAETFMREPAGTLDRVRAERSRRPRPGPVSTDEIDAENIRRIYAALLARAAQVGTPRREAETPFEFLPRLSARYPDTAPGLQALTEAYVAVHYAQITASSAQVRELRGVWQRVRRQLVKSPKRVNG